MLITKSRKISKIFLLILIYFVVAAASFHGYFSKWAFMDFKPQFSFNRILDGTADRPYVYRQLIPQIVNVIDKTIPDSLKSKFEKNARDLMVRVYASVKEESLKPKYTFRYAVVYIMTFISLLVSMFLLREICIEISKDSISGTLSPIIFSLVLPFILIRAGYFYDFFELMFFTTSFLLTLRKRIFWILPLTFIATFNKESFFLFVITLIPLFRAFKSNLKILIFTFETIFIAAVVNLYVKSIYAGNTGNFAEYHFLDNIEFYINPFNYLFGFEINYGLFTPKASSLVGLLAIYIIISSSWSLLGRSVKQHTLLASAINFPLFILFCWRDELRNLSMLFISFAVMITFYLKTILNDNPHKSIDDNL